MSGEFFSIIKKPGMISRTKASALVSAAVKVWTEKNKTKNGTVSSTALLTRVAAPATVWEVTTMVLIYRVPTMCRTPFYQWSDATEKKPVQKSRRIRDSRRQKQDEKKKMDLLWLQPESFNKEPQTDSCLCHYWCNGLAILTQEALKSTETYINFINTGSQHR